MLLPKPLKLPVNCEPSAMGVNPAPAFQPEVADASMLLPKA